MYIVLVRYSLLLMVTLADNSAIVSEDEYMLGQDRNQDMPDFESHRSNRRFEVDSEDDKWHVAHLNVLKTGVKSSDARCLAQTFDDVINRYRKMLKEDATRVEFVSADAMAVDVKDLKDPCLTANSTNKANDVKNTSAIYKALNISISHPGVNDTSYAAEGILTTPTNIRITRTHEARRGNEYQFSSVEYYEDVTDFDPSKCPNEVEVIVLQVDQLRSYDVDCEILTVWRSLE